MVIRRDPQRKVTSSRCSPATQYPFLCFIGELQAPCLVRCLIHGIPNFLVVKPSSLCTQKISREMGSESKPRSFLRNIPLQRLKLGKSAEELEGNFYIVVEESPFPKWKKFCLFLLIILMGTPWTS